MPDLDVRQIAITRVLDAPRELVWRAWTEPARLARWWGIRGWSSPVESIVLDVRPGGAFRLTSVSDEDGQEMRADYVFLEVVEGERLVFAGAECPESQDARTVVTFADLGDGHTEMTFLTTVTTSERIGRLMAGGFASAFERLAEHLAGERPTWN